jgi:ribonucleoside-triphosphate reductase
MQIKKRDNKIVEFDKSKIESAIKKAITAVGEKEYSDILLSSVLQKLPASDTVSVEQIQDVVEDVLIDNGFKKEAKNYIIYREQRRQVREALNNNLDIIDSYLDKSDWEVNENANTTFSLQGLNHYATSKLSKQYWLNKIYSKEIREAVKRGDIHIHDLGTNICPYCCGFSLYDLLEKGFTGVPGKVSSAPAKHFRTALGQVVNFLFSVSGEIAGACAFSNFDTLLAPFIRYDKLDYLQVKQALQEFLFNMNVATRTGFQCLDEKSDVLTINGWRKYNEIKKGDIVATYNLENKQIEYLPALNIFVREYEGDMYNLKNRTNDILISPNHRVVRRIFNWMSQGEKDVVEPIEKILKYKTPILIPVGSKGSKEGIVITKDEVELLAWVISEGSADKNGNGVGRISIYQSKYKYYERIVKLLNKLGLKYTTRTQQGLGKSSEILRLNSDSSKKIYKLMGCDKYKGIQFIPDILLNLDSDLSKLFLEIYILGDGNVKRRRITTVKKQIADGLMHIATNAGIGTTCSIRKRAGIGISKQDQYEIVLLKSKTQSIMNIEKIKYKGIIWCPSTTNGTLVARRNGATFITGNCPFSNITLDLTPSENFAKQPVLIGGKLQDKTYSEFQDEMNIFNKAFFEAIMAGDSSGRVFTFPIPTINVTPDFPWDNPYLESLWEANAKYGICYFANYINSDMKPSDAMSMCCRLRLNLSELKNRGGGGLFGSGALTGSTNVTTINLPRIGYLSKTKEEYFDRLGKLMDLAKTISETKRKIIEKMADKSLYPYSKFYLGNTKKQKGEYYANHFSTIGVLGMNESLLNFMGKDIGTPEGIEFTKEVMTFMRSKLIDFQNETGNLFNLEQSPSESTSFRLALKDKKEFPDIITAGTKETPYYTNSTQLPVNYTDDIFEAIKLQDDITSMYNGGSSCHIFVGERVSDIESVKALVKKIFTKFKMPYISLTPTFSICSEHGYLNGEQPRCPHCDKETEIFSRVVGYIRPVKQFNEGKKIEYSQRKLYKL